MNKLFTKIVGACLGLTMAVGVGVAVVTNNKDAVPVDAAVPSNWVQCADVTDFAAGDSIIIATNNSNYYFNGATKSGPHWNASALSASAPESATADGVITLVSTGTTNKYYLKLAGGTNKDKYVTATKAASKGSAISASDSSGWTFTKSSTNYFQLNYEGNNAKFCSYNNQDFRSYASYSSGQQVTIYKYSARSLSSISVNTAPTKTSYVAGEYFNPTGLVIGRSYSDSTSDTYTYADHTSEFTFSPTTSTALTTSNTSVTITYGGKSTTQSITVTAPKTPGSVSSSGQTTSFEAGEKFAYGGTLTVTYTDSTNATVSPTSFKVGNAGINPTSAGTVITPDTTTLTKDDHNGKTIYVLYTENNTTVYTSYVITVTAPSSVSFIGGTDTGESSGQYEDTLSKSGITIHFTSAYTSSGAYRIYSGSTTTITSSIGNIAKIEFNMNGSYSSELLSISSGGGSYDHTSSTKGVWTGDSASVAFSASAQARVNSIVITLASTDPVVELDSSSATSVSMFKGDTDTSIKVRVLNIESKTWTYTFDEGGNTGLSTSSYINVSAGAAVSNVHTLSITTKAVGSTVLHISVSGTACESTVAVAVNAKPASITIVHSDIHEGAIEIITGKYKQVSFSGEDTEGNAYAIAAEDVTPSATSGASHVTLSGSRITGASEGTAVVRYTLNALTSVYAEVTVNVVDDYIETVGTPTFATGLTDTQGQSPTVSVFTSRPGTMHSGTSTTIPFENYKFSYDSTYASSEYGSVFSYDFSHGTTVDSTHKSQTIYVFCDIDEAAHGSFTVTVEQLDDPLTAITFTNVTNNEVDVVRGNTFQLEWAYTPTNPTDGKEVEFIIDDNDDGIDITVSSTGLISIGASSDLGTALVLIQSAHDDTIQDYVYVSAVLETMKYTVSETVSYTLVTDPSVLTAGDKIVIANAEGDIGAEAYASGNNVKGTSITTSDSKITSLGDAVEYTLSTASENDGTFYLFDGTNYLYAASSSGNQLKGKNSTDSTNGAWKFTYSNSTMSVVAYGSSNRNVMQYNPNNGTPIFNCYSSASQTAVSIYKKSGGNTEMDVTDALFNAIHNNFGEGKTYEWDESCSSFDEDAWLDACVALTEITGYSNYKLNRAVGDMSGNEVEVFLAKYDVIVGKFGTSHDHLDRFAQGGINYNTNQRIVNPLNIIGQNSNTVAIIVVISMVGVAAVGGYFFLRKRKEN